MRGFSKVRAYRSTPRGFPWRKARQGELHSSDGALRVGLLTHEEVDQMQSLLENPGFVIASPLMFSAWGQCSATNWMRTRLSP